jgi:hypothetical protein
MSEREILSNMGLAAAVFAAVILVYLIGGLVTVALLAFFAHHRIARHEQSRLAVSVARNAQAKPRR